MKNIVLILALGLFSLNAFAAGSSAKTCHSADGELVVVDGNINIVNGIGEIGAPESQLVLETLSDVTQSCVDGLPEYSQIIKTKEVIAHYQGEEPTDAALSLEVVICEETRTGTASCN